MAEEKRMIKVKIFGIEQVTHDVKRFRVEKPSGYKFIPGQATSIAIENPEIRGPFTFTCLPDEDYLEFTIKIYRNLHGLTEKLDKLQAGDSVLIKSRAYGAIRYKGNGVFIAGGAGITPFIAILRNLRRENKLKGNVLIFSNKTSKDIILKDELREMEKLGLTLILTLTREKNPKYLSRRIDIGFLRENIDDFSGHFYICGPEKMVGEINLNLKKLGARADSMVIEE